MLCGRRYVCCSDCNVVSNECNEPTYYLVQRIGTHGGGGGYVSLCCVCGRLWSVCDVVVVSYVNAMVAVTVMHLMLFVLHVFMLRESEGDGNAGVEDG